MAKKSRKKSFFSNNLILILVVIISVVLLFVFGFFITQSVFTSNVNSFSSNYYKYEGNKIILTFSQNTNLAVYDGFGIVEVNSHPNTGRLEGFYDSGLKLGSCAYDGRVLLKAEGRVESHHIEGVAKTEGGGNNLVCLFPISTLPPSLQKDPSNNYWVAGESTVTWVFVSKGCIENWDCTAWGDCKNNIQSRTCTDRNSCGTTKIKPAETRGCDLCEIGNTKCESYDYFKCESSSAGSVWVPYGKVVGKCSYYPEQPISDDGDTNTGIIDDGDSGDGTDGDDTDTGIGEGDTTPTPTPIATPFGLELVIGIFMVLIIIVLFFVFIVRVARR